MKNASAEVDRYIEKAPEFAKPILERIRKAFHKAGAEVTESMKWSAPHFEYKGVLGSMAAFKQHVAWGFWKAKLMDDPASMGFGKIRDVKDLPSEKVMVEYVKQAMRLNDEGVKLARPKARPAGAPVDVPDYLTAALKKNAKARAAFENFPSSHRREYVEWLEEAKQEATRTKRLAQAIEWMAEGKPRNWKYMKK
jgi:uncharacterized protein YdeI (YjbR/CyaY-like superfamily)